MLRIIIVAVFGFVCTPALAASPFFEEPDIDVLYSAFSEQPGDGFGWVAEDLGDIDGDGASDFIVSAPFLTIDGGFRGRIYIHSGADGSVLATHTGQAPIDLLGYSASLAGDLDGDGINDYVAGSLFRVVAWSGADHSVLWERSGAIVPAFGFDVDMAGDLNGDGFDDVVVGESGNFDETNPGTVHAFSGIDGSTLWTREGREPGDRMGSAVGRLGDVNGDGVPDVVAGERAGGLKDRGVAYALSGVDGSVIHTMRPVGEAATTSPASTFATFHAAGGGDVDGDGIGDIFIGDFAAFRDGPQTGRAYLYSGRDGHRLGVINAENVGDGVGPGRIVPDVDGDGRADVYVAAFQFGANQEGKAWVRSGRGGIIRTMTGTEPGAFLGIDALSLDDVNDDGRTDFLLTGNGVIHIIAGN